MVAKSNFPSRWQYGDDDRKSSKHDEIVLWTDQNIKPILSSCLKKTSHWSKEEILQSSRNNPFCYQATRDIADYNRNLTIPAWANEGYIKRHSEYIASMDGIKQEYEDYLEELYKRFLEKEKPDIKNIETEWEVIVPGRGSISGFSDLIVRFDCPYLEYPSPANKNTWPQIEFSPNAWGFEIKSFVGSVGDVIRQIEYYRKGLAIPNWVVVAPMLENLEFVKVLEKKGISFIPYLPGMTNLSEAMESILTVINAGQ